VILPHAAVAKTAGRRVERIVIYGAGGCMLSHPRRDEPWWVPAAVAGIGPLSNVALALCWYVAVRQFGSIGAALQTPLGVLSLLMLWINVTAVAMNSLPLPLVDGGHVAAAFKARKAASAAASAG
jgi:Zn-dependent protease